MSKLFDRIIKRHQEILVLGVVVFEMTFPHYAVAAEVSANVDSSTIPTTISAPTNLPEPVVVVPAVKVIRTYHKMAMTAYSSTPDQTDSTPCITANGYDLCKHNEENVIAANFLPFGTKVRIPEHYGDRIFTVQDRMNRRYKQRADIWMRDRKDAIKFGIKYTTIEVVE